MTTTGASCVRCASRDVSGNRPVREKMTRVGATRGGFTSNRQQRIIGEHRSHPDTDGIGAGAQVMNAPSRIGASQPPRSMGIVGDRSVHGDRELERHPRTIGPERVQKGRIQLRRPLRSRSYVYLNSS